MDGMRLRLEIKNLYLKVGNVTRENESYVLMTAHDNSNNEIVLELTHEQAGWLEDQFYNANRRWEERNSTHSVIQPNVQPGINDDPNQYQGTQYHRYQE
ncbi:hypothetical protein [Peribacillus kribbensis]|uniref:hypothetical protein n=1 Tax=Peribacillus kribbensis TaxID=356658 RepID=UPI00047B3872|nr:hypothetical protein [Peribacillus kribbensis]